LKPVYGVSSARIIENDGHVATVDDAEIPFDGGIETAHRTEHRGGKSHPRRNAEHRRQSPARLPYEAAQDHPAWLIEKAFEEAAKPRRTAEIRRSWGTHCNSGCQREDLPQHEYAAGRRRSDAD